MSQPLDHLDRHHAAYLDAMTRQHALAQAHLSVDPPEFSAAATACHRAHQFALQALALTQLRDEMNR